MSWEGDSWENELFIPTPEEVPIFSLWWGSRKFIWAKLRIRCVPSGTMLLTYLEQGVLKNTCDVSITFSFISGFVCLSVFLSKWERPTSNLAGVALRTVFVPTVAVPSLCHTAERWRHTRKATRTNANK